MEVPDKKRTPERRVINNAAMVAGSFSLLLPGSTINALQFAPPDTFSHAESEGCLVYDCRLSIRCQSFIFACSMTNEGERNTSLSRIQIIRDVPAYTPYPYSITMSIGRRRVSPLCVQNYPTGPCHVESANGNVRMIDESRHIGCSGCIRSCPQLHTGGSGIRSKKDLPNAISASILLIGLKRGELKGNRPEWRSASPVRSGRLRIGRARKISTGMM